MDFDRETGAVYAAGLIQGIALVAFPAASTILTSPHEFNLSGTEYGSLFIPQSLIAIAAAGLNPKLSRKLSSKTVFLVGLLANLVSMALLACSVFAVHDHGLAYGLLLFATGSLGLGFGLVVPAINAMAALLRPSNVDFILLVLNALLGVGTALAPVFISLFVALGIWWGLPVSLALFLILLFLFCVPLGLPGGNIKIELKMSESLAIPMQFWLFAGFALLYGIIETLNGNWVSIYMSTRLHATLEVQSLALTAFWGMVTLGRVFFAFIGKFVEERWIFQLCPFLSFIAFILIVSLSSKAEYWTIAAFALNGFGCSALLPLTISFGRDRLKTISSSVPGMVISFYLLGYGIAAFGVGPLQDIAHTNLTMIYAFGAVIAFILGILSFYCIKSNKTA